MKQKKLTRAEKEAQGLRKPTQSRFEIKSAKWRAQEDGKSSSMTGDRR